MQHPSIRLFLVVAALSAACGKSAPAPPPAVTPVALQTTQVQALIGKPAPAATEPAAVVTPIEFEKLIAALPDAPSGWTRGKPKGNQSYEISTAEAMYELGESLIHVEFIDTAFRPVYLAPLQFSLAPTYSERSAGWFSKAAPVGGSPGFERWNADDRSAEVTMVVASRIVVSAKGRNVDNTSAARALVTAIDQKKLKDLK